MSGLCEECSYSPFGGFKIEGKVVGDRVEFFATCDHASMPVCLLLKRETVPTVDAGWMDEVRYDYDQKLVLHVEKLSL